MSKLTLVVRLIFSLAFLSSCQGSTSQTLRTLDRETPPSILEKDCEAGDASRCVTLGLRLIDALDGVLDRTKAGALFNRACELGYDDCVYLTRRSCEVGGPECLRLVKHVCMAGDPACNDYAPYRIKTCRKYGIDDAECASINKYACDVGNVESCYRLALFYYESLDEFYQNRGKGHRLRTCEVQLSEDCYPLINKHFRVSGGERSASKLEALFDRACKADNRAACSYLGLVYTYGIGLEKDASKAAPHFKKACDLTDETGCFSLAFLYEKGLGVERDSVKAATLSEKGMDIMCLHIGRSRAYCVDHQL